MALKIVHLYPRELNLYGDAGNIICLSKRLKKRNIKYEVVNVGINDKIPDFDFMFIGGGQDREMSIIQKDIKRKAQALSFYVNIGKAILAICGGYQILGEYYKTKENSIMELSSALPFFTEGSNKRMIGNVVINTDFGRIVGFENHSGKTYLASELKPFGKIITGYGNNGIDKTEGVNYKNTFGTYLHGPILPKNPAFADELIKRMLKVDELKKIDDDIENICHNQLISRYT